MKDGEEQRKKEHERGRSRQLVERCMFSGTDRFQATLFFFFFVPPAALHIWMIVSYRILTGLIVTWMLAYRKLALDVLQQLRANISLNALN